jgi:hypothetical protein
MVLDSRLCILAVFLLMFFIHGFFSCLSMLFKDTFLEFSSVFSRADSVVMDLFAYALYTRYLYTNEIFTSSCKESFMITANAESADVRVEIGEVTQTA